MAAGTLVLTIDTDDFSATLAYLIRTVHDWPADKLAALARDIDPLIASGKAVTVDTSGKHATVYVSASADLLDVMGKHGLEGV